MPPVTALKAIREEKGMTVEHVAAELGINWRTVFRHEAPGAKVRPPMLRLYAVLYDVDVETLLDGAAA